MKIISHDNSYNMFYKEYHKDKLLKNHIHSIDLKTITRHSICIKNQSSQSLDTSSSLSESLGGEGGIKEDIRSIKLFLVLSFT